MNKLLILTLIPAVWLLAGCRDVTGQSSEAAGTVGTGRALPAAQLTLVAYSTPQQAYEQIIAAFRRTPQGRNITFALSFGPSGDQSRAVEAGLPADVVAFALEPDITRLVLKGIVAKDWNADQFRGMVHRSVVAFAVRRGNPRNIRTWADLIKPGIEVITPNPLTSGGARWNMMAAWGQAVAGGKPDSAGIDYLNKLFSRVPVQDDSARKSLQTFTSGKGDVLLAYENEAIFARNNGQPVDYVVPSSTILIENPIAVTKTSRYPEQARAFLDYLRTPQAQAIFARNGYRPVIEGLKTGNRFPQPRYLFTIRDFGGWEAVTKKFFDPRSGIMMDVERKLGMSVG